MPHKNYELANRLFQLRTEAKLTLEEMAREAQTSVTSIKNWESGSIIPRPANLQAIIKVFFQHGLFTPGEEERDAEELWEKANCGIPFDKVWFKRIRNVPLQPSNKDTKNVKEGSAEEVPFASDTHIKSEDEKKQEDSQGSQPVSPADGIKSKDERKQAGNQAAAASFVLDGEVMYFLKLLRMLIEWILPPWRLSENRDRKRFLSRVEAVCNDSAFGLSPQDHPHYIKLDLSREHGAVVRSQQRSRWQTQKPAGPYPAGTSIEEIYNEAVDGLLILGAPGSGKTELLLELARILLIRSAQDEMLEHEMPVVCNLSSWALKKMSLDKWLVEEIHMKYRVPRKIVDSWVKRDKFILLLDGLDEVDATQRSACIEEINAYRRDHGLVSIVVCSRKEDYYAVRSSRLQFSDAISILPLSLDKINDYLSKSSDLEELKKALENDKDLLELVSSPLILDIVTRTYRDKAVKDLLAKGSLDERWRRIFSAYIDRTLQDWEHNVPCLKKQAIHYLIWLARQLRRKGQSEFYLERLQMDWLPQSSWHSLYPAIGVGLVYGIFFALIKGLNYFFLQGYDRMHRPFTHARGIMDGLAIGALNTALFILLNGLIFGVFDNWLAESNSVPAQRPTNPIKSVLRRVVCILQNRIVYGLIFGILNGILITWLVDLPAGLQNGLFITIIYMGLGSLEEQIKPAEELHWSWISVRMNIVLYGLRGILLGLGYGIVTALYWLWSMPALYLNFNIMLPCLFFGLCAGLFFGLIFVLIRGLSYPEVPELKEKKHWRANQGIRNSARNSVLLGLLFWFSTWLCFALIEGILLGWIFQLFRIPPEEYAGHFPQSNALILGMVNGLVFGAFFWLHGGGTACIQHIILRYRLWRNGSIPWRYPQFLEYATTYALLHRVGNGYMFHHRLLQEQFALLNEDEDKK